MFCFFMKGFGLFMHSKQLAFRVDPELILVNSKFQTVLMVQDYVYYSVLHYSTHHFSAYNWHIDRAQVITSV